MLWTPLCDVLGIDVPIILAAMGGTASSAEFAAAASNEGALGSIGSLFRTSAAIKRDIDVVKELTNRNFAVNHIPPTLDAAAANSADEAPPPMAARMIGTSMPRTSHSGVLSNFASSLENFCHNISQGGG